MTSWIGGAGNTTGGSGVSIAQLSEVGRTTADPPFNPALTDIYVLKLGIVFSQTSNPHTLVIDAPANGFGNRTSVTGDREIYWFSTPGDPFPNDNGRGTAEVHAAIVRNIPGPAPLALLGWCMLRRRNRR